MKRDELKLLTLADHRVALTDLFLHKQREVIEALSRLGHDTTDAYGLLIEFEQMRARLLADRAQLRRELEQATLVTPSPFFGARQNIAPVTAVAEAAPRPVRAR
jgi:hypothetical protein